MNLSQQKTLVELIVDDYSQLTLEDLKFFFRKCMKGDFGSNYNRIDGQTIMQWLCQFDCELGDKLYEKRLEEHERLKNDSDIIDSLEHVDTCPESVQRSLNKMLHGVYKTDAEMIEWNKKKAEIQAVHNMVVHNSQHLYSEMPVEKADAEIRRLIDEELERRNLKQEAV